MLLMVVGIVSRVGCRGAGQVGRSGPGSGALVVDKQVAFTRIHELD